jgi:dynein heavy chain 1
VSWFNAVV